MQPTLKHNHARYDSNGNTLTKTDSTGTTNYTWDFENRLTGVTLPGSGGTVSFKYDPLGRRIYKSSSSGTSIFAYDGDNPVEETNAAGGVVARYSQGLNIDEPLAMLRSSTTSYYQSDGLGSVSSLSNGAGALVQNYTYDSFGNLIATTGSLVNSFRYTGREWDTETSLYYYRARYYDPTAGVFLSEDPLRFSGDGVGFYRYARGNPTTLIDPFGMNTGTLTLPGFWDAAGEAGGTLIGVGARILGGAVAVALQLTVFANATARDEDLIKRDPAPPDCKKRCKPCNPPVGTLGYRVSGDKPGSTPSHFDKPTQTDIFGARWQLYRVSQSPPSAGCKCWWQNLRQAGPFPPSPAGAIPIVSSPTGGGIE